MIARMDALKVFYSYAHEDEALKDELMRHLAVLRHEGLVDEWHDGRIDPGAMWDQEIRAQLAAADIILFLVSSDFLSSRYINDTEIREALERHARGEATLIPIILRPADWEPILGPFQALPKRGRPVTRWEDRDEALLDIARGIRVACERLRSRTAMTTAPQRAPVVEQGALLLDLSHQQNQWDHFADALKQAQPIESDLLAHLPLDRAGGVLILALPFHRVFERREVDHLERWVHAGGGLLLLGYYAADTHHLSNPSHVARAFGFEFAEDLLMPPGSTAEQCREHVFARDTRLAVRAAIEAGEQHALVRGVRELVLPSSCSIDLSSAPPATYVIRASDQSEVWTPEGPKDPQGWRRIIIRWNRARNAAAPVLAACAHGAGRVAIAGTWKLCRFNEGDNAALLRNTLEWLAGGAEPAAAQPAPRRTTSAPASAEEGPLAGRSFIDRLVSDVLQHLREKHRELASPTLPIKGLLLELDLLFDRKTFRHEALADCVTQGWTARLHSAWQTLVVLRAYQRNVRDRGSPAQYVLFKKVLDEVDGYCMRMADGLFEQPLEIDELYADVGTPELERRFSRARHFSKGPDGRLDLGHDLNVLCDGHRVEAAAAMERLVATLSE